MKSFLLFAIFLGITACFASDVQKLTAENFDDAIKNNPYILVEFFAPWCGHCKHLAPEYEKAATVLKDDGIVLASVDATVENELANRHSIQGFPTLIFFRNGKQLEYNGPREAEGIVQWLKKKSGPVAKPIKTSEELKDFLSANPTAVLGFIPEGSTLSAEFLSAAGDATLDAFPFALITDAKVIEDAGETSNTIRIKRTFDADIKADATTNTADKIVAWIQQNGYPYIDDAYQSWTRLKQKGNPIGLLIVDVESDEGKQTISVFGEIAKEQGAVFSFAYIGKDYLPHSKQMGASGEKIPTLVVINSRGHNYPYGDERAFTKEAVTSWLNDIASGAVKPYFRSEPVPETNDGPVKVVVGNTFKDIVLDESKDVFLEFYAPWCGHCKHLEPEYKKLGESYQGSSKVVIAKIDATANDNPAVTIQGYPTIYFFPAGDKANPIEYEGGRTLEALQAFIQERTGEKPIAVVDATPIVKDEL